MTGKALRAIAGARLAAERRSLVFCGASAALVGALAPRGIAGPLLFCSTIGIALALAQGPERHPYLDTNERSAPLFGRELARAKALAPLIAGTITSLCYAAAQAARGFAPTPPSFALALACVLATILVALNATTRGGTPRIAALACAVATIAAAYVLAIAAAGWELPFCAITGFFALREYGESLARYEPEL